MVLIPLMPAIPQLFLQVVTDHQGYSGAFNPPPASHLFGAASAGVTGGEHSLHASLHDPAGGDEAPLVGLNNIFDESGIGVQPDEYERGCRE